MATTYAEAPVYMHPAVFTMRQEAAPKSAAIPQSAGVADVRDLLEAAGPLDISDIAGGLDLPVAAVVGTVAWMLARGELRRDEWERLRAA